MDVGKSGSFNSKLVSSSLSATTDLEIRCRVLPGSQFSSNAVIDQLLSLRKEFAHALESASRVSGVPVELLVAVIWRESNGRNIIGDGGHGHGLMQIDDRSHAVFLAKNSRGLDPWSNIHYGANILRENYERFGRWDAALAAYNAGPRSIGVAIDAGEDIDKRTTGGNYSRDVLSNANVLMNVARSLQSQHC